MKKFLIGLSIAALAASAWALPSEQEVEAQVRQGNYSQAESMMKEVVAAKPGSAKGHYVYAELLAHNGEFAKASAEAARAREIDPDIKFADKDKFRSFEQLLQREQNPRPRADNASTMNSLPAAPAARESSGGPSGIPGWMWGVGLAVVALLLWRGFSRSRSAAPPVAPANYGAPMNAGPGYGAQGAGMPATPYANPYGAAPAAPAAGGGLLRTGAAVAGGVAAGMLVDELLHRNSPQGGGLGGLGGLGNVGGNDPLSGLQRGVFGGSPDDNAASELENRNIDFGNGSDWDSGGDSSDSSSSGGDGGGWD